MIKRSGIVHVTKGGDIRLCKRLCHNYSERMLGGKVRIVTLDFLPTVAENLKIYY